MGTLDHPWQQGKEGTQFSMPSLKEANGPAVMSWCQSSAWRCSCTASFSYISHSSGSQFWPAKRFWLQRAGKTNKHRFCFSDPSFPLLGILIVFYVPVFGCKMKVYPLIIALILLWSMFPSHVMLGQVFCFSPIALAIKWYSHVLPSSYRLSSSSFLSTGTFSENAKFLLSLATCHALVKQVICKILNMIKV